MTARPRVLFVTDDRESYSLGNYYLAYQRGFLRCAEVTLCHPLAAIPVPERFDLVVLGHAAIENFARMRGAWLVPHGLTDVLWLRRRGLRALRRTRTPILLFTKNDYKQFELKNSFIAFVRPTRVVTHTRSALEHLVGRPGVLRWLPFGADLEFFAGVEGGEVARRFDVGFRANAMNDWNGGERERFYHALCRLEGKRPVSLAMSHNGEGFLLGKPYAEWMRSCTLLGNSVSAAGTVGPRFLEAMACGTVPIAPRHRYEEFLVPESHYIPIDSGSDGTYQGLEAAVDRFFSERSYRQALLDGGCSLAQEHAIDRHTSTLCRELVSGPRSVV